MAPKLISYGGGFVVRLQHPSARGLLMAQSNEAVLSDKIVGKGRQIGLGMIANETNMITIVAPATVSIVSTASYLDICILIYSSQTVKRLFYVNDFENSFSRSALSFSFSLFISISLNFSCSFLIYEATRLFIHSVSF